MHERPYNPDTDMPLSGWDTSNIKYYLSIGAELIVDDNNDVWTADCAEYVGRISTM